MFESVLAAAEERRKRFVVYAHGETDLDAQFGARNVDVEHRPVGSRSGSFLAIFEADRFRGAVGLDTLETLLAPPIRRPGELDDLSPGYRALFEVLEGTVFASLDRRQLLATTREIEDRALRVGHGTLRASFQDLSVFESQEPTYRRLAQETALELHVYGRDDWEPSSIEGVTYHASDALAPYWAVAFDGGGEAAPCALLARERSSGFEGFWTYDPDLASGVLEELAAVP
jgi:hypothetical protein